MAVRRITTHKIQQMKLRGEPIPMVTAYDYTAARIVDSSGIPMILVGDSMGHVVLGYDSTIPVTVDDIVNACASVVRGTTKPLIVADMPFLSYQIDAETALRNAARLIQEGGAQAVKLEGGKTVAPIVGRLVDAGVAVMGHIGLTPQHVNQLGGYRVQGKTESAANQVLEDALALQDAGAFAVVLELIPVELARQITETLDIPTIGIGAGIHCDGQVQVFHDMLGLDPDFRPRHSGKYADLAPIIKDALTRYSEDVRERTFPTDAQSFFSDESRVSKPSPAQVNDSAVPSD
ncbi:MAG: 3-methyl-2-oxobutanoate hydroxymethyltransferase [Dehalococcoidia bacterium]|jgi:3-methyl-2-oxobutanoate hydroxymethyltransferase|nr:3-methyl-2-oxobutanoate hydroxymethyltransferase [Dehalococcoidia bacterium]